MAFDANNQPVPPSTDLFRPTGTIPSQKLMLFDGAGREIARSTRSTRRRRVRAAPRSGAPRPRTAATAPTSSRRQGGTTTSKLTDAQGELVEVRQYHAGVAPAHNTPASGYDATTYDHNRKGELAGVTDPGGNHWRTSYDLRGRQWRSVDPDKGTTTTSSTTSATSSPPPTAAVSPSPTPTTRSAARQTLRDTSTTGPKRAEWFYDTLANGTSVKGQLVKTIRYVGTDQYIKEHVGYTVDYKPTSVKYTIASAETGLSGSYTYVYTYHQDGSPATTRLPAVGDLGLETLTHEYNAVGQADRAEDHRSGATYVTGTDYTSFGEVGALHLRNNAGSLVDVVQTYETDTRRLAQIWTTRQTAPTAVADVRLQLRPGRQRQRDRRPHRRRHPVLPHRLPQPADGGLDAGRRQLRPEPRRRRRWAARPSTGTPTTTTPPAPAPSSSSTARPPVTGSPPTTWSTARTGSRTPPHRTAPAPGRPATPTTTPATRRPGRPRAPAPRR